MVFVSNTTMQVTDKETAETVVAFRGTVFYDILNMRRNFLFKFAPSTLCPSCAIHQGFWRNFLALRPMLAVDTVKFKSPAFVGISMGAPLATLASSMSVDIMKTKKE